MSNFWSQAFHARHGEDSEDDDHFQERFNLDPNFNHAFDPTFINDDDDDGPIYLQHTTGSNLEKEFDYNSSSNIKKNYSCKDKDLLNYKSTKLSKELTNQLLKIPTLKYWEHRYEMLTFRTLHCALSDHHKYYEFFLPDDIMSYPANYDDVNDDWFNKKFFTNQVENKSNGHNGHICARAIPRGEYVYNCYDCGVDPTCCLCESCFNKEEHSDHNVSVHRSSGDAICDCGDETSWKKNLDCKANRLEESIRAKLKPLPEEFKKNIKIIIRTLFDFVLDSNLTNFHSLPFQKNPALSINYFSDSKLIDQSILNAVSTLKNLPNYDNNVDTYKYRYIEDDGSGPQNDVCRIGDFLNYKYLIVWNDEFHNFEEAKYFLSLAHVHTTSEDDEDSPYYELNHLGHSTLDLSGDIVSALADTIDKEGFVCYARSKNMKKLTEKSKKFDTYSRGVGSLTPLHHSIMTGREYANLIISRSIIKWFDFILKCDNVLLTDFIKEELSNTLFETANFHLKDLSALKKFNIMNSYLTTSKLTIPQPVLKFMYSDYTTFPISITEIDPQFDDDDINFYGIKNCSRLQFLMFFEMRFPKSMRQLIKKTIIPTISNSSRSRFEFAAQVLRILPTIEYNLAFHDREWHLSLVETFRLQVYHDPNLGTKLLNLGYFDHIIESIFTVLVNSQCLRKQKYHIEKDPTWQYKRVSKVLSQSIEGFDTILKFIEKGNDKLFKIPFFIKIFRLFVGYDKLYPIIRKTDVHQEYEGDRTCPLSHAAVIPLYSIAKSLGNIIDKLKAKSKDFEKFIVLVASYLKIEKREMKTIQTDDKVEVIKFDVTKDGVTMIHPIGALLAEISRNYRFFKPELLLESITSVHTFGRYDERFVEFDDKSTLTNFMGVADEMLQPCVFKAQISCNFWIRNGVEVRFTHTFYDAYKPQNNFFILQQGIILNQLPLEDIIDRFMLTDCFFNDQSFEATVYEEKITMILGEFLGLMYHLLTFRQYYDSNLSNEAIIDLFDEYTICAELAKGPAKYTVLESENPSFEKLDGILEKVADYVPPSSYNDYGQYHLKKDYVKSFDPFTFFPTTLSVSEIEESLVKILADTKNKNQNDVVVTPYLYPLQGSDLQKFKKIGEFMRSKTFVKLLYKVLRFAIDSDDDSHLNITLQLIHAIILDDELYNVEKHDLKYFVQIPICNLLLTAAENTDIPKYITKKASVILEKLLLKDDDVLNSLMDCFGRDHVEEYKKSNHGSTLETQVERKKRLALKRQKKVMKKMMKQQKNFADHNNIIDDDEQMDESESKGSFTGQASKSTQSNSSTSTGAISNQNDDDAGCCIICKNPKTLDSVFGVPGFIGVSSAFWSIPTIDDEPPSFMIEEFSKFSANKSKQHLQRSSCARDKMIVNGCPHGMHYKCFKTMIREKHMKATNFSCPLCKGKFNTFIPSFGTRQQKLGIYPYTTFFNNYDDPDYFKNTDTKNLADLRREIFDDSFLYVLTNPNSTKLKQLVNELKDMNAANFIMKRSLPLFKKQMMWFQGNLRKGLFSQFSIPLLISSTLEMQEINDRRENIEDSFKLPEILDNVLRSLLQYRVLHNQLPEESHIENRKYLEFLVGNPYIGLSETLLLLYTETSMSLHDCILFSILKRFIFTMLSLVKRYEANKNNLKFDSILDQEVKPLTDLNVVKKLSDLCRHVRLYALKENEKDKKNDTAYKEIALKAYLVMATNMKSYERQIKYILTFLGLQSSDGLVPTDLSALIVKLSDSESLEYKFYKIITNSIKLVEEEKFYPAAHRKDYEIDTIEYPKPIHFIDLPLHLKDIAIEGSKQKELGVGTDEFDEPIRVYRKCNHICLHCGKWMNKMKHHQKRCPLSGYSTLFFTPMKNVITLQFSVLVTPRTFTIESPYLNKHGEPAQGMIGFGDAGTLNKERYEYLQKRWFNQSLTMGSLRSLNSLNSIQDNEDLLFPGILENGSEFEEEENRLNQIVEHNTRLARLLGIAPNQDGIAFMPDQPGPQGIPNEVFLNLLNNNMMTFDAGDQEMSDDDNEGIRINDFNSDVDDEDGPGANVRVGAINANEFFGNFIGATMDDGEEDDEDTLQW